MRYLVKAKSGRVLGAIGTFHPVSVEVEAESPDAAILKAYETHDHLLEITVLPVCPNCGQWQREGNGGDCTNECRKRGFA